MTATAEKKRQTATLKHVEAELYQYPHTVKEIEKRRLELLYPYQEEVDENQGQGVNSVRKVSNPTEQIVTRLMEDKRLKSLDEVVVAIESVYNALEDTKMEFVRIKYWAKPSITTYKLADTINVSERSCHYYRREILEAIATKLGWL